MPDEGRSLLGGARGLQRLKPHHKVTAYPRRRVATIFFCNGCVLVLLRAQEHPKVALVFSLWFIVRIPFLLADERRSAVGGSRRRNALKPPHKVIPLQHARKLVDVMSDIIEKIIHKLGTGISS